MATLQESQPRKPAASEDTIPPYTVHAEEVPRASGYGFRALSNATSTWSLAAALDRMDFGIKLRMGVLANMCAVAIFARLLPPFLGLYSPGGEGTKALVAIVAMCVVCICVGFDMARKRGTLPTALAMGIFCVTSGCLYVALVQVEETGLAASALASMIAVLAASIILRCCGVDGTSFFEVLPPFFTLVLGASLVPFIKVVLGMSRVLFIVMVTVVAAHFLPWFLGVVEKEYSKRRVGGAVFIATTGVFAVAHAAGLCIGAYSNLKANTP